MEQRKQIEKKIGEDYKNDPGWKNINAKIKELDSEDSNLAKKFNEAFEKDFHAVQALLKKAKIDIISYHAPDKGGVTSGHAPQALLDEVAKLTPNTVYDAIVVGGGHVYCLSLGNALEARVC